MLRKIAVFILIALVVIQFFHPKRNKAEGPQANYIGNRYTVPDDVKAILAKACNDCHSNNTQYPWYTNIQPVHWFMDNHIKEGKRELNFDEYINRPIRFQYFKMEKVMEEVKEGGMPLNSYLWIHKDAKLTDAEKTKITSWASGIQDSIKAHYPPDSLLRKQGPPREEKD